VVGDAGSLFLPDPWHSRAPRIELRRPGVSETIEVPRVDPYACELEDLAAAVRGERAHPFGRADAVAQARTIAALYRAAESGADEAP
jgi:predicted dehydrogenase